jgi:hypothetical protein
MMATVIPVSLDSEVDKDILRWMENQSNRSAAVRVAIRKYMAAQEGPSLADILAEIRSLPSRMSLIAGAGEAMTTGEEPPEAAANLDSLLDRLNGGDLG